MANLRIGRRGWLKAFGYTPKQIAGLSSIQMHRLAYVGILGEVFGADRVVIPLNVRSQQLLQGAMIEALGDLSEKEASVLRMRFGVDCARGHTMDEIGAMYSVSKERIRQIECKALRKLKHPARAYRLYPFIVRAS